MDPKILVVLGMGGFMVFFFFIIGIIYWVTMDEEEETVEDNNNNNDSSTTTEESGCKTEEVMHLNGKCYPPCLGGEITVNCNHFNGIGTAHLWEHRDDCSIRFLKDSNSSSGYYQCMWNSDHCNIAIGGDESTKKECAPVKNSGGKHLCAEGVTWQKGGASSRDSCECPEQKTLQLHSGDTDDRWRCHN